MRTDSPPSAPPKEQSRSERERHHYDRVWSRVEPYHVRGRLVIPGVESIAGKRVLICACGSGFPPVLAANAGAKVHAVDISPVAVQNAAAFAEFNRVEVEAEVMDLNALRFRDNFFDIVYGSAVLHHIEPERGGCEILRTLVPGGVAYFYQEPSDRNPILRWAARFAFGKGKAGPKRDRFLGLFQRIGSPDDEPLTRDFERRLADVFRGNLEISYSEFVFFQKLSHVMRNRLLGLTTKLDESLGQVFPRLLEYSYHQNVLLRKPRK